jgi:hypothetical protein
MKNFAEDINLETGAYSKCIEVGNGAETSFLMDFEKQAQLACDGIITDGHFNEEFNVVGLSQGALLARYIVE